MTASSSSPFRPPRRIISGGQTGVDRGALEAALALGIEQGGWCPKDRLSEDGTIPSRYALQELESRDYAVRTRENVLDSDATLILFEGKLQGGTLLTQRLARRLRRPSLAVRLDQPWSPAAVRDWLGRESPGTLNVAGPRESSRPGIERRAFAALMAILEGFWQDEAAAER